MKSPKPSFFNPPQLIKFFSVATLIISLSACQTPQPPPPPSTILTVPVRKPPVIGIALGGGAARGFAHIGVLKVLEANQIKPNLIVGTSAGSVIASVYATGVSASELHRIAINLDEASITDWVNPFSNKFGGVIKGDALQNHVNKLVKNKQIDQMEIPLGIVATDLQTGDAILFRRGDTGQAVRASSSVPGVFSPTRISNREYVDGGLSSPVPIRFTKQMGADIVIAVNISSEPVDQDINGTFGVLLQTTTIMGRNISLFEVPLADVVVVPKLSSMKGTDFKSRNTAIIAGEEAMQQQMDLLKKKIDDYYRYIK
jgi:NTE family protein